jgi:hypothetical protein
MGDANRMTGPDALARGRDSFRRRAWSDAYRLLEAADGDAPLSPEDLDALATAAYLSGRDDESESFRARAHHGFLDRGEREEARAGAPGPNGSSGNRASSARSGGTC